MTENDKRSFPFDTTSIDWKTFTLTCIMSMRRYYLMQTPDQLETAEKLFNYRKLLHVAVKYCIWLLIVCIFWCAFDAYVHDGLTRTT